MFETIVLNQMVFLIQVYLNLDSSVKAFHDYLPCPHYMVLEVSGAIILNMTRAELERT